MISDERLEALEAKHASDPVWQWFNRASHGYWSFAGRVAEWFPNRLRLVRQQNPLLAIATLTSVFVIGFVVVTPLYLIIGPIVQIAIVMVAVFWSVGSGLFGNASKRASENSDARSTIRIEDYVSKSPGRDIEEAEELFYELGDVLTNQWLLQPNKYGPRLRKASRTEVRKGILVFVAKKKSEGIDILFRHELLPGRRCAVLELADTLWPYTSIVFGEFHNGMPVPESDSDSKVAGKRRDEFIEFLNNLPPTDPCYWEKIRAQLSWTGLRAVPSITTRVT